MTGHPAISVPCGAVDGKPFGFMIVGRHLDESTVFRVAAAVESSIPRVEVGSRRNRFMPRARGVAMIAH
ncbi:MAG: hypothetical protein WA418_08265 [Bradyrhizobium sp.]